MADEVNVTTGDELKPSPGSAGLNTQLAGQSTTVDAIANASGGIDAGQLMEVDIDKDLFEFESDDTPLMALMLNSKKVRVKSPVVQHYQIDEERTTVKTSTAVSAGSATQFQLPLDGDDQMLCQPYGTLLVREVGGYLPDGQTETPGEPLMLFVVGRDATSNNPIVRCVNGPKSASSSATCTTPAIPAGSVVDILGNALHETQRKVEPDSSLPVPTTIYLQKRGMNRVVSDYFESQRKRIPFTNALLAERAIRKFKRAGNRTLWASRQGKFTVTDADTGTQTVYFTKGVLWQFKRVVQHTGAWTYRQFITLAKMFFTGSDVPSGAICLCGKDFLEDIQCIDFSDHPEIRIEVKQNPVGWEVTTIHTVFGDFQFKWEPTLDKLGYSHSAGIFGEGRLVHYQRSPEHKEKERIDGHEANRESLVVWDALALKGSCHLFVNGEGSESLPNDTTNYIVWDQATAPTTPQDGAVYLLSVDCPGIDTSAKKDELWQYTAATTSWAKYTGVVA